MAVKANKKNKKPVKKNEKKIKNKEKKKTVKKTIKKIIKKRKALRKKKREVLTGPKDNMYQTRIKVVGIGGGGCSIVSEMASKLRRVSFVVANTDIQALKKTSSKCRRFVFGKNLTNGLGCGMNPELGKKAALEAKEEIKRILEGADLCILVSSLGGGTGSGASPVFSEISQELGNITFGIFTLPFDFEGAKKMAIGQNSLEKLKPNLNAFTVIPNEKIFKIIDKKTSLKQSLSELNKILEEGLEGLIEMIFLPGLINIDWADLRVILEGRGKICYLNSIEAKIDEDPKEMVRRLTQSPLNEYDAQRADRILYNISSDKDLKMDTVEQISRFVTGFNKKAKIIFGISQHPSYRKKIRITLLATNDIEKEKKISKKKKPKSEPESEQFSREEPIPEKPMEEKLSRKKPIQEKPAEEQEVEKKPVSKIKLITAPKKKTKKPLPKKEKPKKEKVRKNALQIRKEAEELEKEILEQEKKWEIPAFLRKKQYNSK